MVLTAYFRALPGDRAFLSPSPALLLADLTPASRRQDHTTSPSASAPFVYVPPASTASRPALMTLRNAPLWDRTARNIEVIWVSGKQKYFCKRGWTGQQIRLICFNKFPLARRASPAVRARRGPMTGHHGKMVDDGAGLRPT